MDEFDLQQATRVAEAERDNEIAVVQAALEGEPGDGICRDCGCAIPAQRLSALPNTRRCVSCQQAAEQ